MLNEIDILNTLTKGVNDFPPQVNDNFCTEGTSDSSSPWSFSLNQPHRPFSHPSRIYDKELNSPCNSEVNTDTHLVSYARPSSTPASNKSVKLPGKRLAAFCLSSGVFLSSSQCDKNPVVEKHESILTDSHAPVSSTLLKEESSFNPVVDNKINDSGLHNEDGTDLLFVPKILPSTMETNEAYDNDIISELNVNQSFNRESTLRAGIKRPHSAALCHTSFLEGEDPLMRPLSAPKRLIEEIHLSSNLNSILASPDGTPVASVKYTDINTEAPKSTLEALVASTSPLMFFPHEFSIETECGDKFGEFAPEVSHNLMSRNVMSDLSYSIDLTSPNTELSTKGEADLNAVNSVSSSKSMTSLDLNDPNLKCPDSHGSQKSVCSDLGLVTDVGLEGNNTATTHINEYVQAIKTYAAELCPVDCVILLEQCRPFNCDSLFMKYFRDQYLCPILSNLNGGPPLNADFGRDAYTSLYSLHGYCWRKPLETTILVPDTPIIYKILKRVATIQHEARHANEELNPSESTPGDQLLQAAVREFDAIDRARRGLCKKVQRHLILLAMSPVNISQLKQSESSYTELGIEDVNLDSLEYPLKNLKMRGVALSVFSPIRSPSLFKLYELVNGVPPLPFYDRRWQTVALSDKLLQADIPERRIVGPLAAAFHAQTEAELSALEHKQLITAKQTFTNGHSNRMLENSHPPQNTTHTIDHSPNNRGNITGTTHNIYPPQEQHLQQQASYSVETTPAYAVNSNSSLVVATDGSCRSNPSSGGGNSSSQYTNGALSPMASSQFCANTSPVDSYQRGSRNSAPTVSMQQHLPQTTNLSGHPARGVCGSGRVASDNVRSVEGITPLANSLSTGHSGPNSVDQTPGSVYGSDSVATPQGMYASQAGTVSPLQTTNATYPVSQLHSPVASGGVQSHQPTPPGVHSSYNNYHFSTTSQIYQYQQQSLYDQNGGSKVVMSGPTATPNSLQNSFRPPSNAASPSSQYIPTTMNTTGLSSPCSSRVSNKQYSPQLTPHQQGSPQSRLACPTGNQKSIHPQFVRGNQLSAPTLPNNQMNENFTSHSRSNTPTSTAYSINSNNTTVNSSPLNAQQYANYISKDTSQHQQTSQQPQMKISSPQTSSSLVGNDVNLMQLSSSNMSTQSGLTVTQQTHRRGHISTSSNMPIHQSPQIVQQQQQLCPNRSVLWEGEIHVADPNGMAITGRIPTRFLLEQCAVRDISQINMQMWGSVAQLSVIQAYRDSPLVERLSKPLANGHLLARLLVDLPDAKEASNLIGLLSPPQGNQMMIPLGILSPSSIRLSNPIQPGIVGFICLIYNPKRNRIHGLIPYDSEQFRQDVSLGRYTNNSRSNNSNNLTPELNNSGGVQSTTNHFPRAHPNSQTFPQGNSENQAIMMNVNSQYMNTLHAGNNNSIPLCDTNSCSNTQSSCLNTSYQYHNQSHIPQYMPHVNTQGQTKSQTMNTSTSYQGIQLNQQRSTPSPHNVHDNIQTRSCIPSYPSESDGSTHWLSSTNRSDGVVAGHQQNSQLSMPGGSTILQQSVRTLQSGLNSQMVQQSIAQRSGMTTPYPANGAYHSHSHNRPPLDRLSVQTPLPMQCNQMSEPLVMMDQPPIHNSPLTGVLLHGQQQQPQSNSHFASSNARFQGNVGPASVSSYHRNTVPQIQSQNSVYSQQQLFNQRDHYLSSQSQSHVTPSGNMTSGYTCYPSRNTMVTNNMTNPSGHRFVSGPSNLAGMQMSNQQQPHIPKHPHTSLPPQTETSGSRHGTSFSHQGVHTRPGLSNNTNCNTSVDSLGPPFGMTSQDLTQHMMQNALHGSLRQQPSYDHCGPGDTGGGGGSSSGGNTGSQGFF
ncbi:unnamed protein product [Trichobilharzia szidati]|nr:unnamed protein product [Trichobilharzia szidati]